MPNLRYLRVQFDQKLHRHEIPRFRAAVIERTQRASDLFHNHASDTQVIFRYPLIQYKTWHDDSAGMVCLEAGTEDIHHLFRAQHLDLRIGRQVRTFKVRDLRLSHHDLRLAPALLPYRLDAYLPFNSARFADWKQLDGQPERQLQLLESTLRGNLLSFAKGIDWWIEGRVEVRIERVRRVRAFPFKQQPMVGFDLDFSCNVVLPAGVGLGKGVSGGFGVGGCLKKSSNE